MWCMAGLESSSVGEGLGVASGLMVQEAHRRPSGKLQDVGLSRVCDLGLVLPLKYLGPISPAVQK